MKIGIRITTFALAVFSAAIILTFLVFSRLFSEPAIFYLSIPFGAGFFLFSLVVFHRESKERLFKTKHGYITQIFLAGLSVSFMFAVLMIPSYVGSAFDWGQIPLINWFRYIASLFLVTFLPGYFLVKIIDRERALKGSIMVVLSYLLSIFVMFLAGFCILMSGNAISSLGSIVVVAVDLTLMTVYYSTSYFCRNGRDDSLSTAMELREIGLISCILTVVVIGAIFTMITNLPLTAGDMQTHQGVALQFLNGFPVEGGSLMPPYPYLFYIYLAALFSLSGIPSVLTEQGLFILNFIPLLAFYSVVRVWFDRNQDRGIPLMATFLSILLGFGGLYAVFLSLTFPGHDTSVLLSITTLKTYDIYMRVLYLPDIVAPIWNTGLPALLALLYILKKNVSGLNKAVIIPILVALGYLGHIAEIFFFMLILLIYVLFYKRDGQASIGLYVIVGLIIVALIDLLAPAHIYVSSSSTAGSILFSAYFVSFLLAILISLLEAVKVKRLVCLTTESKTSILHMLEKGWRYGKWVMLYSYFFFLIVWLTVQNNFNLWLYGGADFTPFFVFPLRLGPVGLLAMISIFLYLPGIYKDKRLFFFLVLIPVGFILEQVASYHPLYYPAYRFATISFIGSCVIAVYGITRLAEKRTTLPSRRGTIATSMFLCIIITGGFLSTTLYYVNSSYYSVGWQITREEEDGLNYIRLHTLTNASVLSFTQESSAFLRNFAGVNIVQDAQRWSELLLSTSNPYIMTYVLGRSNVRLIYITQRDVELLGSNRILQSLVEYFPIGFRNSFVTIFEVPSLTPPSSGTSNAILDFSDTFSGLENASWIDDSFNEYWQVFRENGSIKSYQSNVYNGIIEISVISNQSGNVWVSYSRSGLSLNTTTYPYLYFRYCVQNNLTWFTLRLWNSSDQVFYYFGRQTDQDFTTKVSALPQNQTLTRIEILVETIDGSPADTMARVSVDYVKLSAPTSYWKDDTFLRDWGFNGKNGTVIGWSANSDGDLLTVSITSNQSGNVWISYSIPVVLKTNDSDISFRYKVDNGYTSLMICARNASDYIIFFEGNLTDGAFSTKSYSLPDRQTISRIEIVIGTTVDAAPLTSAIAELDYIAVCQSATPSGDIYSSLLASLLRWRYSYLYVDDMLAQNFGEFLANYTSIMLSADPPISSRILLDWVSEGKLMTVVNSHRDGFFAGFFGINASSPPLSVKQMGSGKILYINLLPYLEAGNQRELLQPDFLQQVKEALTVEGYEYRAKVIPVYNSSLNNISVNGSLTVSADALILRGDINLTDSHFSTSQPSEIKIYGKAILTFDNARYQILPSESFLLIKPQFYPVGGEILLSGPKAMIFVGNTLVFNSDIPLSLRFRAASLYLYARLPSIDASGTIVFDQLDVHAALYVPLAGIVQQRAEVQGSVRFGTMYVSASLIVFSSFEADGRVLNLAGTVEGLTIPWVEVFCSSYNLLFNVAFLIGMVTYIVRNRKLKKALNGVRDIRMHDYQRKMPAPLVVSFRMKPEKSAFVVYHCELWKNACNAKSK